MNDQMIYDVYEFLLTNKESLKGYNNGKDPKDYVKNAVMDTFHLTIEETLVILESKEISFIIDNYFMKDLQEIN